MNDTASPAELHTLYREHHGWLRDWLRGKTGCSHDAADLAQDTFVRLITSPPAERLREPRHFLATIARGLMIDLFRRRDLERAYLEALSRLPEPEAPPPEQQALILETLLEIDAMFDGLGTLVKRTFVLSQFEGLTYAQIAQRLGISLRTVNKYMARAMEQLCRFAP